VTTLVALAAIAVKTSAPSYAAGTSLMLVPPSASSTVVHSASLEVEGGTTPGDGGGDNGASNALLSLTDSMSVMAESVTTAVTASDTRTALRAKGAAGTYGIVYWRQSNNAYTTDLNPTPVMLITATAASPEQASATAHLVVEQLLSELSGLQTTLGAPPGTLIKATTVAPVQVVRLRVSRTRAGVALLALAVGASLLVTKVLDAAVKGHARRYRRQHRKRAAEGAAA
jgi:hypothetical protein